MAFITSPSIIRILNAVGVTVVPVARSIQFNGSIVVTTVSTGAAVVNGTGFVGVGAWDVAGNGGGGLRLGTTTADAWSMISNNVVVAGFDGAGILFVSSPSGEAKSILSLIVDPTAGAGVAASLGTIAMVRIGATARTYQKTGAANTAWTLFTTSAVGVSSFNTLTGAVTISAGAGVTLTPVGNNIAIASTGGGVPVGTANSIPYYNGTAVFTSTDPNLQFHDVNQSVNFGITSLGGVLIASGIGSLAFGQSINAGSTIQTNGTGSLAFGKAITVGVIQTSDAGAFAGGFAQTGGLIQAIAEGSFAFGWVQSVGSQVSAEASGAVALGNANNGGKIKATADGGIAFGLVSDAATFIQSKGTGSLAGGNCNSGGTIVADGGSLGGSFAMGFTSVGSILGGSGATVGFAWGVTLGGSLSAGGQGSLCIGYVTGVGQSADASGNGSFCGGGNDSVGGNSHVVSGQFSISYGTGNNLSAYYGQSFGIGLINQSYNALHAGRFSVASGTAAAWVSTEPLFVLGNGASNVSRANAFQIDKDGREITTASHLDKMRVITGDATLNARTDFKVVNNSNPVPNTLTLPQGEQGLTFIIGFAVTNAGTTLAAFPGDTIDGNVNSLMGGNTSQVTVTYDLATTTWYAL